MLGDNRGRGQNLRGDWVEAPLQCRGDQFKSPPRSPALDSPTHTSRAAVTKTHVSTLCYPRVSPRKGGAGIIKVERRNKEKESWCCCGDGSGLGSRWS